MDSICPNNVILPSEKPKKIVLNRTILTYGMKELIKVWNYIKGVKHLKLYLLSYFFYSMGVQTIMLVASYFRGQRNKS